MVVVLPNKTVHSFAEKVKHGGGGYTIHEKRIFDESTD